MARPKKEDRELTIKDIEKGIALARKLMDAYVAILEAPSGDHPSERQLEAIGRYLKDNGITLESVMNERNKKTASDLGEKVDDDRDQRKGPSKERRNSRIIYDVDDLPFTTDEHGNSIPNPNFRSESLPTRPSGTPTKIDLM